MKEAVQMPSHVSSDDPSQGLNDHPVKMKNKKKAKSRSKEAVENTCNVEAESRIADPVHLEVGSEDVPSTPHKRKKKKKNLGSPLDSTSDCYSALTGTSGSDLTVPLDGLEKSAKKKKRHFSHQDVSPSVLQPASPSVGDTTLAEQTDPEEPPMFKKKKKKHKIQDDENIQQTTGMIGTASEASTPKRKRGQEKSDEIMECNMEEQNGDTVPHTLSKRKKKISSHVLEETTDPSHGLSSELDLSLGSLEKPPRKKKKHSEDTDSTSGLLNSSSNAGGDSILEQTDSEEQTFQKSKKKKNRDCDQNLGEKGFLLESSDHDVPLMVKKKKKKKKSHELEQECFGDLEEDAEPEVCGLTLSVTKKKSKKRNRSDMEEDQSLVESCSIGEITHDEIDEQQEPENFSSLSSRVRRESRSESQEKASETDHGTGNTDEGRGDQETNTTDSRIGMAVEAGLENKRKKRVRRFPPLRQRDLELLKEYFPNLERRTNSTISHIVREDLERIRAAKIKGIPFMTGRFTTEENQRLEENVKEFMALTGISSGDKLFSSFKYPDEKSLIERVKRMYNFRRRIAEGIPRTTTEVFIRGGKMFDLTSNKGHYSKEEVEQLKKHMEMHGNKWRTIAPLMGRNNVTLQLKASQMRRETNSGKWSAEEVNKLIDALKNFIVKPGKGPLDTIAKCDLYSGIPWVQVEEKVETRNWSQCKIKWSEILLLRMNNGVNVFQGASGIELLINMIKWLHDFGPAESGQIKWEELAEVLGNIPPLLLQNKFVYIKRRYIPDYHNLTHQEILYHLYTETIPHLEERLNTFMLRQEEDIQPVVEKSDSYLINEIFCEYIGKEHEDALYITQREKRKRKRKTRGKEKCDMF
uniref:Transcription termination factor, RNA polymerase I n=1 Tax=Xenopus tropicalis TaxID=8364 RepID=A0A803JP56_XENTR